MWKEWYVFLILTALFFAIDGHNLKTSLPGEGSLSSTVDVVNEGRMERKLGFFTLFGLSVLSLFRKEKKRVSINGHIGWIIILFITWAVYSLAWSNEINLTFRRIVVLIFVTFAAFSLSERFSVRMMMLWLFLATLLYSFIGLIAEISFSTFTPFQGDYRFSGSLHPNHQGINCALTVISGLCLFKIHSKFRKLVTAIICVSIVLLILTKSRTAFMSLILVLAIYSILTFKKTAKISIIFTSVILFCLLALFAGDALFPAFEDAVLMGRDSEQEGVQSLTGRTPLWGICMTYLWDRPVLGYGYGAFWTDETIARISASQHWLIGESHNAYLEIALQLGLIGAMMYVWLLLGGFIRAFHYYNITKNAAYLFIILLLVFCIFNGLLESGVIFPGMLMFLCFSTLMYLGFTYE